MDPSPIPAALCATGNGALRQEAAVLQEDLDEHFCVVIRVRPPLERELASPVWQHVVSVTGDTQVCLHEVIPEANAGDRASGSAQVVTNHCFAFDRVYSQDSSQPEVYESTAHTSVMSTLQGYNATILAYGPTGTGKTYTMEGSRVDTSDARGIIPRSMEEIFQHIKHCRGPQSRFLVRASYLQIYNEVISDLLKPNRAHLVIREDRRRGVFVEGLSEWLCRSPAEVHTLMEHGSAARATAQTAVNDASSRSHAVFIVVVEQSEVLETEQAALPEDEQAGPRQRVCVGRLNLVDLAGSERPRLTGATGQRLEETKKINQSLSALGNVISALTERRLRQHVPYRDSKLTRLLEDSLGGNCRTTMMAMVSPAAEAFAESLSTLKFAHRAKSIRQNPQVNEDVDQRTLLRRYEAELRRLRAELRERDNGGAVNRQQLMELEEGRRRAEEDRQAAVSALQERGLVLEREKAQKQRLEERIRQMSSQLLVGGSPQSEGDAERVYAARLAELERERESIEGDKAQVGRYKQLLLKQRDIMIALTQRLHERDETIMGLQDELDARDRRIAELEDHPPEPPQEQEPRYPPERNAPNGQLLTADEKISELMALLHCQRQENHRLTLELAKHTQLDAGGDTARSRSGSTPPYSIAMRGRAPAEGAWSRRLPPSLPRSSSVQLQPSMRSSAASLSSVSSAMASPKSNSLTTATTQMAGSSSSSTASFPPASCERRWRTGAREAAPAEAPLGVLMHHGQDPAGPSLQGLLGGIAGSTVPGALAPETNLREEAERAVDALLARRKAEMRRASMAMARSPEE